MTPITRCKLPGHSGFACSTCHTVALARIEELERALDDAGRLVTEARAELAMLRRPGAEQMSVIERCELASALLKGAATDCPT